MKISPSSWHYRVFDAWFRDKHHGYPSRVNLCPYVRAVLFWSWLRYALNLEDLGEQTVVRKITHVLTYGGLLQSLNLFLASRTPHAHFWWFWLAELGIAAALALVCVLVWGVMKGIEYLEDETPAAVTFRQLLAARIRAQHNKICPLLEIERPTETK